MSPLSPLSPPKKKSLGPLTTNDLKVFVAAITVAIATFFGGYRAVLSEAHAQVDAGVEVITAKHDDLRREVERYEKSNDDSLARMERKQERVEQKLDLVLDALRVPKSARPVQTDAGE